MKVIKIPLVIILAITLFSYVCSDNVEERDSELNAHKYSAESTRDEKTISNSFADEWEKEMSDYEADYVYMIPLKYKSKEVYYETIETVPVNIRGAFMTDEEKEDTIDFLIIDPSNNIIYKNSTNVCIFNLEITQPGRYQIVFNNRYVNTDLKVTFTMKNGQNSILKKEDLSISNQKLDNLLNFIQRFDLEFKFNRNIHNDRYKSNFISKNFFEYFF